MTDCVVRGRMIFSRMMDDSIGCTQCLLNCEVQMPRRMTTERTTMTMRAVRKVREGRGLETAALCEELEEALEPEPVPVVRIGQRLVINI
jgi:hypothetical protein